MANEILIECVAKPALSAIVSVVFTVVFGSAVGKALEHIECRKAVEQ